MKTDFISLISNRKPLRKLAFFIVFDGLGIVHSCLTFLSNHTHRIRFGLGSKLIRFDKFEEPDT